MHDLLKRLYNSCCISLVRMQPRRTGQYKAELTLSPRLDDEPLIAVMTAIQR